MFKALVITYILRALTLTGDFTTFTVPATSQELGCTVDRNNIQIMLAASSQSTTETRTYQVLAVGEEVTAEMRPVCVTRGLGTDPGPYAVYALPPTAARQVSPALSKR